MDNNMKHSFYSIFQYSKLKVFILFILVVTCGCDDENEKKKKESPEIEVTAIKIDPQNMPIVNRFVGKTTSVSKVEIRARTDGFLEKRLYEEGTMVEKGQELFQMDQKPAKAKLENTRAALKAQEAALEYAKVNLERTQRMITDNVVARKELDFAQSSYQTALAGVEQAKANVIQGELDFSYTVITSPINGLSSFSHQEVGAYIGASSNSLLTYVAELDPMRVEFSVSENQILKALREERTGLLKDAVDKHTVEIELGDGTKYPYKGEVTFADASISDTTGTFLIRARIPNPEHDLRPGQFVRVSLFGSFRPDAVAVPKRAVQENAKGSFVWIVDKDMTVKLQPVILGDWYGKAYWFINNGLEKDDIVVVDGVSKLAEGVKVKITEFIELEQQ